jgi:hypothetical protein
MHRFDEASSDRPATTSLALVLLVCNDVVCGLTEPFGFVVGEFLVGERERHFVLWFWNVGIENAVSHEQHDRSYAVLSSSTFCPRGDDNEQVTPHPIVPKAPTVP